MSVADDLARLVRWVMRDATYHTFYTAEVERDAGNSTVDVLADDMAIRGLGLQGVPVRPGIAGSGVRVEHGTRCLIGFENGDPRRPYVAAWQYAKGTGTVLLDQGDAAVARKGDLIKVSVGPAPLVVQGMGGGIMDVPNPMPPPATIPTPVPPTSPFIGTVQILVPVVAVPIGGAPKVLA